MVVDMVVKAAAYSRCIVQKAELASYPSSCALETLPLLLILLVLLSLLATLLDVTDFDSGLGCGRFQSFLVG